MRTCYLDSMKLDDNILREVKIMRTVERTTAKIISDELKAAAEKIMKKHGLVPKIESVKYGYNFKCSIMGIVADATNPDKSAEQMTFERHAHLHGFKAEDFGKQVTDSRGDVFTLVGYRPKARKNDMIIRTVNGAEYVINHRLLTVVTDEMKAS